MKKNPDKKKNQFVMTLQRTVENKVSLIGLIILGALLLMIIFANVIAPYDPNYMDVTAIHGTPSARHILGCDQFGRDLAPYDPNYMDVTAIHGTPSARHILGCDQFGRDLFSRILYGGRYSLALGFICAIIGFAAGVIFGSPVGYAGGTTDMVVMRLCDIFSAIPGQLLAILISSALGTGYFYTILAMTIGGIPNSIRGTRAMALKEREMEYLEAAEAMNVPKWKIVYKHMVPNIVSPSIVGTTMMIGNSIMGAAGLTFVGLGVGLTTPEWGAILSNSRSFFSQYPHEILFPGLVLFITVLAINMIGDGLRDALDPKLKR